MHWWTTRRSSSTPRELQVCHFATMTNWGGVERMLVDLLTHVGHDEIHHLLLSTSSIPEIIEPVRRAGVPVFQPRRRWHYDPGAILQMAHWLRTQNVQLVHAYNAFANSWGNVTSLLGRVPIFVSGEHGSVWWIRPPMAWLDRWACYRANLVIANSKASATLVRLRYAVPARKIRIVYNGVPLLPDTDVNKSRAALDIEDKLVVGSVGRLDTPKDFSTFIKAAALVLKKRRDVRFVLVGGGPLESELKELVCELGIQESFIIMGWRADARALVQIFDIFVSTSVHETFGNALVEAALAGKPTVASSVDGIPEVVHNKVTGILLSPTRPAVVPSSVLATPLPEQVLIDGQLRAPRSLDPCDVADAVLHLLDRPDLREQYGHAGRKHAEMNFSIERYAQELEGIYLELTAHNRGDSSVG